MNQAAPGARSHAESAPDTARNHARADVRSESAADQAASAPPPTGSDLFTDRSGSLPERFATPVTGPAYRASAKIAAVTTVLSLFAYGARVIDRISELPWTMWMLLAVAMLGVVVTTWYILTGHTTVDARGVRQQWLAPKDYTWSQIIRARHIRLPFTSRLMIRIGAGPMKAIQSGTPELDAAFKAIAAHYKTRPPTFRG